MSIPRRAHVSWLALLLTAALDRGAVAQECLDWSADFAPCQAYRGSKRSS